MKLHIKNMVCHRCKLAVQQTLEKLGHPPVHVELGEVDLPRDLSPTERQQVADALEALGFALIDDKKSRLITQVKALIVELVHEKDGHLKENLSDYLSDHLHHDYSHLSSLFSETEGTTIEKFYIAQKIERVKELLVYDELTLSEIAYRLHYSSVAHLSNQFKKVTGLTPSYFKQIGAQRRKGLDEV